MDINLSLKTKLVKWTVGKSLVKMSVGWLNIENRMEIQVSNF